MNKLPPLAVLPLILSLATSASSAMPEPNATGHEPTKIRIDNQEVFALGFDKLSDFPYTIIDAGTGATPAQISEARKRDQVPGWIKFYQDKRVVLTGYLMPLQLESGRSKKFVMMKDITTCCYGAVPNMNDYVVVAMKGDGIVAVQDVPVALVGIFRVEERYEDGYVTSLFVMEGEKFLGPKK